MNKKRLNIKHISRIFAAILLVVSMITTLIPVSAATSFTLPEEFNIYNPVLGARMWFNPPHKYASHQNPPDFTWPDFDDATSWEIVVCSDSELTDIKYTAKDIKRNYYSFKETFEPGTYWWAVRAYKGNSVSNWSVARRFRLDKDYDVFIPPTAAEILEKTPKSHPRILFTQDTWDSFVKEKTSTETGKKYWENLSKLSDSYISSEFTTLDDYIKNHPAADAFVVSYNIREKVKEFGKMASIAALAYWYTKDEKYADYAVKRLLEMATWDLNGETGFEKNDQTFYYVVQRLAIAYDWMYNYMSSSERKTVGDALYNRFISRAEPDLMQVEKHPTNSHMRAHCSNYIMGATALLYEYEDVQPFFEKIVNFVITTDSPFTIEDGGYSKGWYWMFEFHLDQMYYNFWEELGVVNLFEKTNKKNSWLQALYMYPMKSYGNFGDGAITSGTVSSSFETEQGLAMRALKTNNPVAQWEYQRRGGLERLPISDVVSYLYAYNDEAETVAPIDFPRGWCSFDTGFSAMHSDLIDQNRISMYFRSGQYGSDNHMRADLNAFVIEAYGDRLANHSGSYDYYHSYHDYYFTRRTYASNSITIDGGTGQSVDDINAKGNIDMFATSKEFDAVVGDATQGYVGNIGKFIRSIIYVRPDTYIIVDDLAAAENRPKGSVFEWWLNTYGNKIYMHEDGKGAAILGQNYARLDARIQYPENVTGYYSNIFSGPDLINIPVGSITQRDERIWFETEKLKETKMISTINVHSKNDLGAYINATNCGDYMKLEFENGLVAYVSTITDPETVITAENVEFAGTAVVLSEDSIMLVGGTSLKVDGKMIVESDRAVTVTAGYDELTISSNDDFNVSIGTQNDFINNVKSITDRDRNELSPLKGAVLISDDKMQEAIKVSRTEDETLKADKHMFQGVGGVSETVQLLENSEKINILADKGYYNFLLNDKQLPGAKTGNKFKFDLIIDGEKQTYEAETIIDADYEEVAYIDNVKIDAGKCQVIDKSEGASILDKYIEKDTILLLAGEYVLKAKKDGDYIELKSDGIKVVDCEQYDFSSSLKSEVSILVEAEGFSSVTGSTISTNDFFNFASGGNTIRDCNDENDSATYKFNVSEDGDYDFMLGIASWVEPSASLFLEINDKKYMLFTTHTGGWGGNGQSDFDILKYNLSLPLKAGENTFTIRGNHTSDEQNWNLDWIGFIKK